MPETDKFLIQAQDPDDRPCSMTVRVPRRIRNEYDELSSVTNIPRDELAGRALQFALDRMEVQKGR